MTIASSRVVTSAKRIYQTTLGKRFSRFVLVAAVALAASQISLTLLLGVAHMSPGAAGVVAAMIGAAVSYIMSRWAWERRGKPDVLKETLPFWAVSVGAWIVLGLASHFASIWAHSMGLAHWDHVAFVDGAYFVANCLTFASRFVIFHYLLFVDRGPRLPATVLAAPAEAGSAAEGMAPNDSRAVAAGSAAGRINGNGSQSARVNGWAAWMRGSAGRSADPLLAADGETVMPEPGSSRR